MVSSIEATEVASPPQTGAWIGLDVSKETFDAALGLPQERPWVLGRMPWRRFARTPDGARQFVQWHEAQLASQGFGAAGARVAMEATGSYSLELAQWLSALRPSLGPAILNPLQVRSYIQSLALRNKTDALDARALARFGFERQPAPYQALSPAQAELRALVRGRDDLVQMRVAEENRLQEPCASPLVLRTRQAHIQRLNRDIQKFEVQMKTLVRQREELRADVALLDTIGGVGFLTAAIVVGELGDLRRFRRARQLSAFAGVTPRRQESGTSVHRRPRMSKQGVARVRQALYMSAMSAIRGQSDLAQLYRRLVASGKERMVALGVVMRKLLLIMRAMLIAGNPYQPSRRASVDNFQGATLRSAKIP